MVLTIVISLLSQSMVPALAMPITQLSESSVVSLQMPSMAMTSTMGGASGMKAHDCRNMSNGADCCDGGNASCFVHCLTISQAFIEPLINSIIQSQLLSVKVFISSWTSTPVTLTSQTPPPLA